MVRGITAIKGLDGVVHGRTHNSEFDSLDLRRVAASLNGTNGDLVPIDHGVSVGKRRPVQSAAE